MKYLKLNLNNGLIIITSNKENDISDFNDKDSRLSNKTSSQMDQTSVLELHHQKQGHSEVFKAVQKKNAVCLNLVSLKDIIKF